MFFSFNHTRNGNVAVKTHNKAQMVEWEPNIYNESM